jgi:hypothetical protein
MLPSTDLPPRRAVAATRPDAIIAHREAFP